MKLFFSTFVLLFIVASFNVSCQSPAPNDPWAKADSILQNIKEPQFPNKTYNVVDFGAVGDGTTVNTKAINSAIGKCSLDGGGQVLVTGGKFLTGPIHLKSNVDLHIDEGATLMFTTNPKDYLPLVLTRWEGDDCYNYSPLIYADGQKNIAITGKGTLDGCGSTEKWWPWKGNKKGGWKKGMPSQLDKNNRPLLKKYNDNQVPVAERQMGEGHYLRPQFINLMNCNTIKIEDVTITNSPFWVIHPLLSENVIIRGVTVNSMGPNNDGCDPESCKNVLIEKCTFNTGDDCIALKSGRDYDGRKAAAPIENVIVRDCHMKNGHGGVAMGSEIAAGCKNIFVEDCKMDSPLLDRAIRIKTNSNRGGVTDGVYVRNVEVGQVAIAVVSINCSYHIKREGSGKFFPMVKNVYVSDLTSNKSPYALWLQGLEGHDCVENINIENCTFSGVQKENEIDNVKNVTLKNVMVNGKSVNSVN